MYQGHGFQMNALLKAGKLDLDPVITDRMPMAGLQQRHGPLRTGDRVKFVVPERKPISK